MKYWKIIKAAIWTVLAVLVLVFRDSVADALIYLVGWLILVYGAEKIIIHFATKKQWSGQNLFFWGAVETIIGVVMISSLADVDNSYVIACIIWAIWAMLREALEIQEAINEIVHHEPAFLTIIESVVSIIFSVLLIVSPDKEHAIHHIILLSIELISTGLIFPLERYIYAKYLKNKGKNKKAEIVEKQQSIN
ncbi:MAG: DUF308 domain-containing protein [Bacilli bacterium]|nr:DUF308 domain-containing protein [Bacilli bacterium]